MRIRRGLGGGAHRREERLELGRAPVDQEVPGLGGGGERRGEARRGAVRHVGDDLLTLVDLADAADRRAGGYSLGMRQRLGLAAALLGDPARAGARRAGQRPRPAGDALAARHPPIRGRPRAATVLVSSHVLAEVAQTADEVVVIARGRSVAQAPLKELLATSAGGMRVAGPDTGRLSELLLGAGAAVGGRGRRRDRRPVTAAARR